MSSRKVERIESKKRRAAAFLRLTKDVEAVEAEQEDSDDETHSSKKKPKIPEAFGNLESVNVLQRKAGTAPSEAVERPVLSEDVLLQLRKRLREKQKSSMSKSKIFLTLDELASDYGRMLCKENPVLKLPPLFLMDVQHLLLHAIQNNFASFKPRWCRLLRPGKLTSVVVIVLDGVGSMDYESYPECFSNIRKHFEISVDMVTPDQYGCSVADELLLVPFSKRGKKIAGSKNLKIISTESVGPIIGEKVEQNKNRITPEGPHPSDKFPRTHLLLSTSQMVFEGFPMPNLESNEDFVYTKNEYGKVTDRSPMFAVDCEMCLTSAKTSELTRISVVNEDLECIYDTFVKPFNSIQNYLTRYSGVTKEILDPVKTRLKDVQNHLRKILPDDAILCGQSLCGDLNALQMFHPFAVDTSVIYNLSGVRGVKPGLKKLTAHFLGRDIQNDLKNGHSSVEDSTATMELVQLKLANDFSFGDCVFGGEIFPTNVDSKKSEANTTPLNNTGPKSDHSHDSSGLSDNAEPTTGVSTVTTSVTVKSPEPELEVTSSVTVKSPESELEVTSSVTVKSPEPEPSSVSAQQSMERQKSFFRKQENCVYNSIFGIVKEMKKTAALLDVKSVIDAHADEEVVAMEVDCDRMSKSLSKSYVEYHDFVYSSFPSYRKALGEGTVTEEEKKSLLGRMDKRLGKVLKHTRENSLVTVVLSGQSSMPYQSAKTFIKVV